MRRILTLLQVLTVGILLNISSLVACPMMQPEMAGDSHACCPRPPEPAKKCPISPTMDTCPLNITESKFGTLKSKADVLHPLMPAGGILVEAPSYEDVPDAGLRSPLEPSRIYLENRVLRI